MPARLLAQPFAQQQQLSLSDLVAPCVLERLKVPLVSPEIDKKELHTVHDHRLNFPVQNVSLGPSQLIAVSSHAGIALMSFDGNGNIVSVETELKGVKSSSIHLFSYLARDKNTYLALAVSELGELGDCHLRFYSLRKNASDNGDKYGLSLRKEFCWRLEQPVKAMASSANGSELYLAYARYRDIRGRVRPSRIDAIKGPLSLKPEPRYFSKLFESSHADIVSLSMLARPRHRALAVGQSDGCVHVFRPPPFSETHDAEHIEVMLKLKPSTLGFREGERFPSTLCFPERSLLTMGDNEGFVYELRFPDNGCANGRNSIEIFVSSGILRGRIHALQRSTTGLIHAYSSLKR